MDSDTTTLLLATRSVHKAKEIAQILGPAVRLASLEQVGVEASPREDDIEVFETFFENALAKARYFHSLTGLPTLADDSGICADALGGRPGVRSRRFSERLDLHGIELDLANNRTLSDALAHLPENERGVRYVCAAVLVRAAAQPKASIGTVRGRFIETPRGDRGFGYDPHFLLPELGLTFGEIHDAAKHRLSHRGIAFHALARTVA